MLHAISISRTRNEQAVAFVGRQVLGQTIMTLPGNVRHQGAVEDVTESFADMLVQQRAAAIREAKPAIMIGCTCSLLLSKSL